MSAICPGGGGGVWEWNGLSRYLYIEAASGDSVNQVITDFR